MKKDLLEQGGIDYYNCVCTNSYPGEPAALVLSKGEKMVLCWHCWNDVYELIVKLQRQKKKVKNSDLTN